MAIRVRQTVDCSVFEDTLETKPLAGSKDADTELEQLDSFTQHYAGRELISATVTEALTLGGISTASGLWLRTTGDVDIVFNGGGDTFQVRKATAATYARVFMDANITQISVTAGAADVTIDYRVWA